MIRYIHLIRNGAFGTQYMFEGLERLPTHSHEPETYHTVECISGDAVLIVADEIVSLPRGTAVVFDCSQLHTVQSLEPGTVIFHRWNTVPPLWTEILGTQGIVDAPTVH